MPKCSTFSLAAVSNCVVRKCKLCLPFARLRVSTVLRNIVCYEPLSHINTLCLKSASRRKRKLLNNVREVELPKLQIWRLLTKRKPLLMFLIHSPSPMNLHKVISIFIVTQLNSFYKYLC
jgi:hypothetical protein